MLAPSDVLSAPRWKGVDGIDRNAVPPEAAADLEGAAPAAAQECLVADARGTLTPAQMVERKLISLLKNNALAVSQVQLLATGRSRGR
jgi:hypothetical protein